MGEANAATNTGLHVRVEHLSASFRALRVLDDVSLDIGHGEIISITGRSGVGKSTLLRMIGGLLNPTSGTVAIDGAPVANARANKQFGFMPQSPALLPWRSVVDNVRLPSEVNKSAANATSDPMRALETVGLRDRANDKPSQLSGGMKHRVALARAISTGAPILLLDEPFASVDEYTRDELYRELLTITSAGGQTLVLVTHNLVEAALLSDRVIVLAGVPARIAADIRIVEPRPRTNALDSGRLSEPIARLRRVLHEDPE